MTNTLDERASSNTQCKGTANEHSRLPLGGYLPLW
eukprot:COSAG06_NODE_36398_length_448_cov_1.405172_1_plen_34_part_10